MNRNESWSVYFNYLYFSHLILTNGVLSILFGIIATIASIIAMIENNNAIISIFLIIFGIFRFIIGSINLVFLLNDIDTPIVKVRLGYTVVSFILFINLIFGFSGFRDNVIEDWDFQTTMVAICLGYESFCTLITLTWLWIYFHFQVESELIYYIKETLYKTNKENVINQIKYNNNIITDYSKNIFRETKDNSRDYSHEYSHEDS
jgi:hypothetical protein